MSINRYIGKAGQKWSSLSKPRKIIFGGGAVAVLIGLIVLGQLLTATKYAPLFTDLPTDQAGAVVEKLDEMKISYKVDGDGSTILVPEDILYKTRLQLASSGVLEGTDKGFELFDQTQLGTTDFERKLNYQRALQTELERTIGSLEEVESSRVHLVLPEESLYTDKETPASASIVLDLKPLAKLKPEQVKGIIYLVSKSVENLPPENVNIIDTAGNILSEGIIETEDTKLGMKNADQEEMKKEFEKDLEDRVGKMLEKIMGPGKAVVMITAELNFDQRQVTRIDYGDDGVVRSEELVEKSSVSAGNGSGTPGTTTNVGTYGTTQGGSQESSTETDTKRNYEIDEQKETTVFAPGQLMNLSTSVAVDGNLSPADVTQIQSIVQAGVGYNPGRGDQISVVSRSFDNTLAEQDKKAMEEEKAQQAKQDRIKLYILVGAVALVLAIVGGIFLMRFLKRRREEQEMARENEVYPIPVSEMAAIQEEIEKPLAPPPPPPPAPKEERIPTPEEIQRKEHYEQIREIASTKPDEAAALVRAWLTEE